MAEILVAMHSNFCKVLLNSSSDESNGLKNMYYIKYANQTYLPQDSAWNT